jgi:hypothetical protein
MKKKKILLLTMLFALTFTTQAQVESGLLIGGGLGSISSKYNAGALQTSRNNDVNYKANVSLGYRFRVPFSDTTLLFADLDANLGLKLWHSEYGASSVHPAFSENSSDIFYTSLSGTLNYSVLENLSIGAGVEPTYYFRFEGEDSSKHFDTPIVGKVAYNFDTFEIGFSYKYGLMNVLKTDYLESGKIRDWQISVWIPF